MLSQFTSAYGRAANGELSCLRYLICQTETNSPVKISIRYFLYRAPRKISPYGVMTGVRVRSAVDCSILGLSSRLPEVAAGFSCWLLDRLNSRDPTRGAPVHLAAAAILSRQTKRRML